jgi:molecular chaperone DnaK (HSP70)
MQQVTILNKNRLNQKDIEKKAQEAEEFSQRDGVRRERVRCLNALQELVRSSLISCSTP